MIQSHAVKKMTALPGSEAAKSGHILHKALLIYHAQSCNFANGVSRKCIADGFLPYKISKPWPFDLKMKTLKWKSL